MGRWLERVMIAFKSLSLSIFIAFACGMEIVGCTLAWYFRENNYMRIQHFRKCGCPAILLINLNATSLYATSCLLASWSQVNILKNKFGFDEAFNYKKEPDLNAALERSADYLPHKKCIKVYHLLALLFP